MEFKTEQEILLSMIAYAQQNNQLGEIDDIVEQISNGERTENQYVVDYATHSYIVSDFTELAREIYMGTDIATARGVQLDNMGKWLNVPRLPGLPASVSLQLSLALPETHDIIIPSGTVVLIDELQVDPYLTYTTDSSVTIHAGTTSASVTCSSDLHGLQRRVPAGSVLGLEGYPTVLVTNPEQGTTGRNIEDDDAYRLRILLWNVKNERGSKSAFDAYLGAVEGLDDYKLIPRPEGVGTLTVVCDCEESRLTEINQGIQENCMLYNDDPVQTVNPSLLYLDLDVHCMITREPIQHTVSEIIELVRHEVETYVNGGITRLGDTIHGLRIGEDFISSQLVMHLHTMFPELVSITVGDGDYAISDNEGEPADITDYHKLLCRTVEVDIL